MQGRVKSEFSRTWDQCLSALEVCNLCCNIVKFVCVVIVQARIDVSRTAHHVTSGFLYQFLKTLLDILESDDDATFTVEGKIEDIDKWSVDGSGTATQCKYHSSVEEYVPSILFGPLLEMMQHFVQYPCLPLTYCIYLHIPGSTLCTRNVSTEEVIKALDSSNSTLQQKISSVRKKISLKEEFDDTDDFVEKFHGVCKLEFGESIEDLQTSLTRAFEQTHLPKDNIQTIYMSNALHLIFQLSTAADEDERKISRVELLEKLEETRSVVISELTLALKTRKQLLKAKRKELVAGFGQDARERGFFLSQSQLREFRLNIVKFIKAYVDKYHMHATQRHPPLFLIDCEKALFNEICQHLLEKRIRFKDGIVGENFNLRHFRDDFSYPVRTKPEDMYFRLRISCTKWTSDVLAAMPLDDLFLVGDASAVALPSSMSVDIEYISVRTFDELKFLLGLNEYLPDS